MAFKAQGNFHPGIMADWFNPLTTAQLKSVKDAMSIAWLLSQNIGKVSKHNKSN